MAEGLDSSSNGNGNKNGESHIPLIATEEAEKRVQALRLLDEAAVKALNGLVGAAEESRKRAEAAYIESAEPLGLSMPSVAAGNFVDYFGGFWPKRFERRRGAEEHLRSVPENLGALSLSSSVQNGESATPHSSPEPTTAERSTGQEHRARLRFELAHYPGGVSAFRQADLGRYAAARAFGLIQRT